MRKLVALCVLLVVGTLALPSGELRFRQRRSQQEGALALQQKLAAVDDAEVFNLLRMAQQFTPVEDPADPISPQLEHRLAELQKEISDSLAAVKLAADQGVQDQGMASAGRELLELYYHLRAAVEHHVDKFNTRNEVRQLVADVEELDKKKAAGSLEMDEFEMPMERQHVKPFVSKDGVVSKEPTPHGVATTVRTDELIPSHEG